MPPLKSRSRIILDMWSRGGRRVLSLQRRRLCSQAPSTAVRHEFDIDALKLYLLKQSQIRDAETMFENMSVSEFSHGQSNPTYIIKTNVGSQKKFVLRKQPPGALLRGAHAVDREHRVMSELGRLGAPVPQTLLFCEDSSVLGTPFFMYEFVNGRFYKDPVLPDPSHNIQDRKEMMASMAGALAKIHSVHIALVPGLHTYGRPTGYIMRQIKTWSAQYELSKTVDIPEMDQVMEWLPAAIPDTNDGDHVFLVHGDFRMDNLLYNQDDNEVAAVLDWELSTLSDTPLGDLAYNCMMYHLTPRDASITGFKGLDYVGAGIPSEEEYLDIYARALREHSGGRISLDPHQTHTFFLSFSFFRAAAILQGVYKRSLDGNAAAPNASIMGDMAIEMAEKSWYFANKYDARTQGVKTYI